MTESTLFDIAWNASNHYSMGEEVKERAAKGLFSPQEGNLKGWGNHQLQKPLETPVQNGFQTAGWQSGSQKGCVS